ncbi:MULTISPECIES: ABC transporter ATP-binding protein [unclassified Beijerinckia]|uniref:ABC transporter ATP-binding protein n=1 Tax=unclassified Beijerinckia TaxID=2638183 RepID=UPI00089B6DA6|nr:MULTISPECIES: ABC transporter ATP-binding protein [unclassified Beijerinckia]MDH7799179.1 branched-chain amino acid transport system ATP-binding protein [Beijerinckia sp. GAS462]SED92801.1 amino acid/amide ABC transporter ATP-binding protein 2, HAAT family [Beijerinckia sp. 28-YEA-48]
MTNLLTVQGLSATYGASLVLWDVDLVIAEGEIVALLGANGAGKTTTLRALCQMMVSTKGRISFGGVSVTGRTTEQIARLGIGHVPDGRGTFLGLTTEENLRLGLQARPRQAGGKADIARIYDYFPRLSERRKQQAGTLSGGEQQMLAIGRALVGKPKLLLLDEPSFGLAPLVVKDIFAIMRRINQEEKVAILLVEQNAKLALDLAHTAYLIETGRIVKSGRAGDIRRDDAVRQVYLGG